MGRNDRGRIATLTSFSIFDSYDMKSLLFEFGHDTYLQWLKVGMPVFQLFYEMKFKTSKFKVLVF